MSLNRLYQLIANDKPEFMPDSRLSFKSAAKDDMAYVMYNLGLMRGATLTDDENNALSLAEHHLSFYEIVDTKNPYLSEYHYTGILKDNRGNQYQLHVYFDQRDQLTTTPLFKLNENGNYVTQTVTPDFSERLTQFAQMHSMSTLRKLRQHHAEKLDSLQQSYQSNEKRLCELSIDLKTNHDAYLQQLEIAITKAEALAQYCDNPFYRAVLSRFKKIRQLLLAPGLITPDVEIEEPSTTPVQAETDAHVENIVKKATIKPLAKELIEAAKSAEETFKQSSDASVDEQVKHFISLDEKINKALLYIDNDECIAKVQDLSIAIQLASDAVEQGKKLLTSALLHKNFTAAEKLSKFTTLLPENTIRMALGTNNAPLLDFLLTHSHVPVNTFIVKDELTPVQFCLEHSNEKSPKAAVLEVLIRHGASIMAPAKDELPAAYHILSKHAHPLKLALKSQVTQPAFWRSLAANLRNHLADHPEISDASRETLQNMIERYISTATLAASNTPGTLDYQAQRLFEQAEAVQQHYSEDQIQRLKSDPEVMQKIATVERLTEEYFEYLTKAQKRQLNAAGSISLENLDKLLQSVDVASVDLKSVTMPYLNNRIECITSRIQLALIQEKARKGFRSVKAPQRSLNKQRQLIEQIKTLESVYQNFSAKSNVEIASAKSTTAFVLEAFRTEANAEHRLPPNDRAELNSSSSGDDAEFEEMREALESFDFDADQQQEEEPPRLGFTNK